MMRQETSSATIASRFPNHRRLGRVIPPMIPLSLLVAEVKGIPQLARREASVREAQGPEFEELRVAALRSARLSRAMELIEQKNIALERAKAVYAVRKANLDLNKHPIASKHDIWPIRDLSGKIIRFEQRHAAGGLYPESLLLKEERSLRSVRSWITRRSGEVEDRRLSKKYKTFEGRRKRSDRIIHQGVEKIFTNVPQTAEDIQQAAMGILKNTVSPKEASVMLDAVTKAMMSRNLYDKMTDQAFFQAMQDFAARSLTDFRTRKVPSGRVKKHVDRMFAPITMRYLQGVFREVARHEPTSPEVWELMARNIRLESVTPEMTAEMFRIFSHIGAEDVRPILPKYDLQNATYIHDNPLTRPGGIFDHKRIGSLTMYSTAKGGMDRDGLTFPAMMITSLPGISSKILSQIDVPMHRPGFEMYHDPRAEDSIHDASLRIPKSRFRKLVEADRIRPKLASMVSEVVVPAEAVRPIDLEFVRRLTPAEVLAEALVDGIRQLAAQGDQKIIGLARAVEAADRSTSPARGQAVRAAVDLFEAAYKKMPREKRPVVGGDTWAKVAQLAVVWEGNSRGKGLLDNIEQEAVRPTRSRVASLKSTFATAVRSSLAFFM